MSRCERNGSRIAKQIRPMELLANGDRASAAGICVVGPGCARVLDWPGSRVLEAECRTGDTEWADAIETLRTDATAPLPIGRAWPRFLQS